METVPHTAIHLVSECLAVLQNVHKSSTELSIKYQPGNNTAHSVSDRIVNY